MDFLLTLTLSRATVPLTNRTRVTRIFPTGQPFPTILKIESNSTQGGIQGTRHMDLEKSEKVGIGGAGLSAGPATRSHILRSFTWTLSNQRALRKHTFYTLRAQSSTQWIAVVKITVRLNGGILMQATIHISPTGNSPMSDVSTIGLVSFNEGCISILRSGGDAAAFFGTEGCEHILLNTEVHELRSANRMTHRMTQEESAQTEQGSLSAVAQQNQGFQIAVQVSTQCSRCESSARYETSLMMKLKAAQLNYESTMEQKEREFFSESETKVKQHKGNKEPIC